MPRFLTLWFECGEALYHIETQNEENLSKQQITLMLALKNNPEKFLQSISNLINNSLDNIPIYMWLTGFKY